ncbi:hypothetical protein ES708_19731 [subsurface metagenome]
MYLSGSPDCNIDRTFISTFYFQTIVKKSFIPKKTYRNPINLAREYKEMIDKGKVKNQAGLARLKGVSRARITQLINILKLDNKIKTKIEKLGDPLPNRAISERQLRKIINKSKKNNTCHSSMSQ